MSKVRDRLPQPPKDKITIMECNREERGCCEVYLRTVMELSQEINNPDIPPTRAERKRIMSANLCQSASHIPFACPKYNKAVEDKDMNLFITVRDGTFGVQYDKLRTEFMESLGDIPNHVKEEQWKQKEQGLNDQVIDISNLRTELTSMGLPEDIIEQHIQDQVERMNENTRRHFVYRFGLRCPACHKGEVNIEDGICKRCGLQYHQVMKKLLRILKEKQGQ
jgi:hypothetical protein